MRETAPMDPKRDLVGYRQALARFPTGVAFVAARAPDGEAGGLLINCTHDTVLRFLPPYIVTEKEVDRAIRILRKAMGKAK